MWPKVVVAIFVVLILYNLGAGLYYMIVDKGQTKRTVNALTWRVGLSAALIVFLIVAIWTGIITPHGVGG
ncbi:MAG: twin transmembrane helix small protein [Xanthomonadales bacterium]|nr:twin transmembrane helix small protein [Xanthomonadales bacterium]HET9049936.1 twin transmembrane helix small protein [Chiayiivirga sp.]